MDLQEYNYYEENAADVDLEQVTSLAPLAGNDKILQRLRYGDDQLTYLDIHVDTQHWRDNTAFIISEGDDLGSLGHLIGNSQHLRQLNIWSIGEQQIDAFVKGIASNHSIQGISIGYMSDDVCAAIVRAISNYSQLERLAIGCYNFGKNSHSALGTLLESGICSSSLRELKLFGNGINGGAAAMLRRRLFGKNAFNDDVVATIVNGFCIGTSLKALDLSGNSIGNKGLLAVVDGLANSTSLKTLNLSWNDLSLAAEGLSSLSEWLHSSPVTLQQLNLSDCHINDQGLQAFTQGSAIHCRELDLRENGSITATGLSSLSNSLQSESCRVEILDLRFIPSAIGNDGMKALALGLAHNTSMRILRMGPSFNNNNATVPPAQWLAFSKALCDSSSVNSTYLSNHTIHTIICNANISLPEDVDLYLRLNKQHRNDAARCKILMKHPHLEMQAFLPWGLKFLPLALTWFEEARACTKLFDPFSATEERRILGETDEVFESRVLSAMYEFVRGTPMLVMKSPYVLELVAALEHEKKKLKFFTHWMMLTQACLAIFVLEFV